MTRSYRKPDILGPFSSTGLRRLGVAPLPPLPAFGPNGLPWPKVSIVTASFNQGRFIEENILSIIGQRYPNLEHLVVDGGSNDETIAILQRYESLYNLRWTSAPDHGQSDAINKGFRRAEGEIVGWLNSDDTYLPGAVMAAVEFLINHPDKEWVSGDGFWIDENSTVLDVRCPGSYTFKELVLRGMYLTQPSLFLRRTALHKIGLLDVHMHTTMDYDFCLRLGRQTDGGYLPVYMATRRLHAAAKTIKISADFLEDGLQALHKLFSDPSLADDVRALKNKAFSHRYFIGGLEAFRARRFPETRRLLRRCIALAPYLWRVDSILSLLLLVESLLGVSWFNPGYRNRRAARAFLAKHGAFSVKWLP